VANINSAGARSGAERSDPCVNRSGIGIGCGTAPLPWDRLRNCAASLRSPEPPRNSPRSFTIDQQTQHPVAAENIEATIIAAARRAADMDRGLRPSLHLGHKGAGILDGHTPLPRPVRQLPLPIKNRGMRADFLKIAREPAHQIDQVHAHIAQGAKAGHLPSIAPSQRRVQIRPCLSEPDAIHVVNSIAHVAFFQQLLHPSERRNETIIEGRHVGQLLFFGLEQHGRSLVLIQSQRLFAQNMNTPIHRLHGYGIMQIDRRRDAHGIEPFKLQELPVIGKYAGDLKFLCRVLGALPRPPAKGLYLYVLTDLKSREMGAAKTPADHSDSQFPVIRMPRHLYGGHRQAVV